MLFEESGMKVDSPLIIKEDNQAYLFYQTARWPHEN